MPEIQFARRPRFTVRGWSIQRTIFTALLLMVLIVAYVLSSAAYSLYSEILLNKTMQEKKQAVELAASNLMGIMDHVNSLSRLAVLNITLQQLIGNSRLTPSEEYNYGYVLKDDFNYMLESNRELTTIIAYLEDGRLYASSSVNAAAYTSRPPIPFERADLRYTNKLMLLNTHEAGYLANRPPANVVTVYRPLISYLTTNIHGILQFDILEEQFAGVLRNTDSADGTSLCITDKHGLIISSPDKERIYSTLELGEITRGYEQIGGAIYELEGKEYLSLSQPISGYDWTIVATVPTDVLMRENRAAANSMYLIVAVSMMVMLLPIYALSRAISRPLKKLAQVMAAAGEGDLSVRADERYGNEVGALSRVFNKMLEQISELLHQTYAEQQQKRKFEFLAMQAQIKPHFLYNTLDNVCALILLGHQQEAFTMCKALARFYRQSLSRGSPLIPLGQEIEIVRNYLVIQEIRFKDRFRHAIELDERLEDAMVPKLIVQPLVENALSHGIRDLEYPGEISVRCVGQGDYVVLSVRDNGKGFSEDSLRSIDRTARDERSADHGFGLSSIIQRLRFYYDPDCKLTVTNHEHGGCTVSIVIKKELNPDVPVDDRG